MLQRQVKVEEVDEQTLRLKAPNLPTYELSIRPAGDAPGWHAVLYYAEGDAERQLSAQTSTPARDVQAAWEAGFELYRQTVIV
jgi:hypothetical protein